MNSKISNLLSKLNKLEQKAEWLTPTMTDNQIRWIIHQVCIANGHPEYASLIKFEWSNLMTNRMGQAWYPCDPNHEKRHRMDLSLPIFHRASERDRIECVAHETAHLLSFHLYGEDGKGHGYCWKQTMRKAGYEPKRCHSVNIDSLRRQRRTYKVTCRCTFHVVSRTQYDSIQAGRLDYYCQRCGTSAK